MITYSWLKGCCFWNAPHSPTFASFSCKIFANFDRFTYNAESIKMQGINATNRFHFYWFKNFNIPPAKHFGFWLVLSARWGLGPRNDVLTTCKAVTFRGGPRIIGDIFGRYLMYGDIYCTDFTYILWGDTNRLNCKYPGESHTIYCNDVTVNCMGLLEHLKQYPSEAL